MKGRLSFKGVRSIKNENEPIIGSSQRSEKKEFRTLKGNGKEEKIYTFNLWSVFILDKLVFENSMIEMAFNSWSVQSLSRVRLFATPETAA